MFHIDSYFFESIKTVYLKKSGILSQQN